MRDERLDLDLAGIAPVNVSTGSPVDLGQLGGVAVLTLIRHRF